MMKPGLLNKGFAIDDEMWRKLAISDETEVYDLIAEASYKL